MPLSPLSHTHSLTQKPTMTDSWLKASQQRLKALKPNHTECRQQTSASALPTTTKFVNNLKSNTPPQQTSQKQTNPISPLSRHRSKSLTESDIGNTFGQRNGFSCEKCYASIGMRSLMVISRRWRRLSSVSTFRRCLWIDPTLDGCCWSCWCVAECDVVWLSHQRSLTVRLTLLFTTFPHFSQIAATWTCFFFESPKPMQPPPTLIKISQRCYDQLITKSKK